MSEHLEPVDLRIDTGEVSLGLPALMPHSNRGLLASRKASASIPILGQNAIQRHARSRTRAVSAPRPRSGRPSRSWYKKIELLGEGAARTRPA